MGEVKARPIPFSGQMVLALLSGRKTQTRRAMKPQPSEYWEPHGYGDVHRKTNGEVSDEVIGWGPSNIDGDEAYRCRYGKPGDFLYVREALVLGSDGDAPRYAARRAVGTLGERSDFLAMPIPDDWSYARSHVPNIHMPRWASRFTLKITDVWVERVQDISDEDARAEGVRKTGWQTHGDFRQGEAPDLFRDAFCFFWDSINEKRGFGWKANPWVWAISFEVIKANVDDVLAQREKERADD